MKISQQNLLTALIVLLGLAGFFVIKASYQEPHIDNKIVRDTSGTYKYTNPILDCEASSEGEESVFSSREVEEQVNTVKGKYKLGDVALYFRDLNNGPWVGVNIDSKFLPASLLKTPILIAFLRYAQDNPSVLEKKVIFIAAAADTPKQNITFDDTLIPGKEYTLLEITKAMIQQSDNAASHILLQYVPEMYLRNVFAAAGVPYNGESTEMALEVREFAGFFRILFNASYLSRDFSEKALKILAGSEYKDGLIAGIPQNVPVAHKFGEHAVEQVGSTGLVVSSELQLHDCGIIYYPNHPYLLCVMTRGSDFTNQQSAIKDISSFFYKKINALHGN